MSIVIKLEHLMITTIIEKQCLLKIRIYDRDNVDNYDDEEDKGAKIIIILITAMATVVLHVSIYAHDGE